MTFVPNDQQVGVAEAHRDFSSVARGRSRVESTTHQQHRYVGLDGAAKRVVESPDAECVTDVRERKVDDVSENRQLRVAFDPQSPPLARARSAVGGPK